MESAGRGDAGQGTIPLAEPETPGRPCDMDNKTGSSGEPYLALARRVLHSARPFNDWPQPLVEDLAAASRAQTFEPDTLILRRGEVARSLYIVVAGSVEISAASADGRRLVIRYGGPQWAFGLLSVLDGQVMNHYCRAHERTTVLVVPKNALFAVLRREPSLWESIVFEVVERNRFILRQFAEQAFEPLRVRLARAILILAESYGVGCTDGVAVELRLAKDRLGELLGVTRQSVTKEIKRLESEGVLTMHYGRILIRDVAEISAIARPDSRRQMSTA
jgi:CRP/FNR family cyclic AMP-dependent transcriptional regulator